MAAGKLAALTFEVAAVKSSTVTLSETSLVDTNAKQTFPQLSGCSGGCSRHGSSAMPTATA